MKISELVRRTKVPKETIHYYIRAGVLPKPRKLGPNVADYHEGFVERIRLIKVLQSDFFLPLPAIKKIMWHNRSASKRELLKLRIEYFRPLEQYLGARITGREAFLEATGLSRGWLARLQQWGIIGSRQENGRFVFSQDDLIIGKVVKDMGRLGFTRSRNFQPEVLREAAELYRRIVRLNKQSFRRATEGLSPEERRELADKGQEIMGVFFYHLYRKFSREENHAAGLDQED